jgi:hypothetical protein
MLILTLPVLLGVTWGVLVYKLSFYRLPDRPAKIGQSIRWYDDLLDRRNYRPEGYRLVLAARLVGYSVFGAMLLALFMVTSW